MPIRYLPVAGTWGWRGAQNGLDWWRAGSPFTQFMTDQGFLLIGGGADPFVWTTDVVWWPAWVKWPRRFYGRRLADWYAGGVNLHHYLRPPLGSNRDGYVPIDDRTVIAHSHAAQVVLFACADGLRIKVLVTVGSPVRADLREVARKARLNIGYWLCLYSDGSDAMQWLGEFGDGALGIVRKHPLADRSEKIPGVGHSKILCDPAYFDRWVRYGWLWTIRQKIMQPWPERMEV